MCRRLFFFSNTTMIIYFQQIESLIGEGNKSRTVAATNMNAESSRSHAVFNITLTQTLRDIENGVCCLYFSIIWSENIATNHFHSLTDSFHLQYPLVIFPLKKGKRSLHNVLRLLLQFAFFGNKQRHFESKAHNAVCFHIFLKGRIACEYRKSRLN